MVDQKAGVGGATGATGAVGATGATGKPGAVGGTGVAASGMGVSGGTGATGATGVPHATGARPEPGRVLDPQPDSRRGEGKVLDPSGPKPEQGADHADTGVDIGRQAPVVQQARGLQPPVGKGGLVREVDADDFFNALMWVIHPLPAVKEDEVKKLFTAFMDYAVRGAATSFDEARRKRFA